MLNLTNIIVAVVGGMAAISASYFTAQATIDTRVNAVDTKIQVVTEREENHYAEVQSSLTRIESKLDKIK